MLCRVIHAGQLHEIEAPAGCHVEGMTGDDPMLVIPDGGGEGIAEYLAPRVVVRAAKDHLFGLIPLRSTTLGPDQRLGLARRSVLELADA